MPPMYDTPAEWGLVSNGPNLHTGTIKAALVTSAYTFSGAHDFFDDITNQVTGDGYTAGGATIANTAVNRTAGVAVLNGDPVSWPQEAGGFSNARGVVIYRDSGVAGTSELLRFYEFAADLGNVLGPLTISPHATDGWLRGRVNVS